RSPTRTTVLPRILRPPPSSTLFPYTTLFRSHWTIFSTDISDDIIKGKHLMRGLPIFHTVLPVLSGWRLFLCSVPRSVRDRCKPRSEEHTSELQSRFDLVCRLLLEQKKTPKQR